jgi:hypothetical protein
MRRGVPAGPVYEWHTVSDELFGRCGDVREPVMDAFATGERAVRVRVRVPDGRTATSSATDTVS